MQTSDRALRVGRLTAAWLAFLLAVAVVPGVAATSGVQAPHASATIWLACGAGTTEKVPPVDDPYAFRASALRGPVGVENGSDPAAVALREFIAQGLALPEPLPAHTYVLLHQTATTAMYGHVVAPGGINAYIFFSELNGQWQYQQNGLCAPAPVFRGSTTVDFGLDERPDPTARSLTMTVSTQTCEVGRDPAKRLRLVASWTRHRLVLTVLIASPPKMPPPLAATGLPPGAPTPPTCAGIHLGIDVKAVLPRALGHRIVFDGSAYPPAPATVDAERRPLGSARRDRPVARHWAAPVITVTVP